ncbi:hypothetical protein K0M31_006264 [Melipona bicolor]|uniref:Uncharacterized protein n=1 Tax=Melipona bicolor TaxID=60889 RepID=A0AA40KLK8_9HYME|nr:hypothetical protein K0M31_006264 [Melipona bicolor]
MGNCLKKSTSDVPISAFLRTSYASARDEHVDSTVSSPEVLPGVTKVRRIGRKSGRSSYSSREYSEVSPEDSKRCTVAYPEAESDIEPSRPTKISTFRNFIENRRTRGLNLLSSELRAFFTDPEVTECPIF